MGDSPLYAVNLFLLLLINKDAAWTYGSVEQSKAEILNRDRGEKKDESQRCHVAASQNLTEHCSKI